MGDEVQASWDTWGPQTSNPMPGQKTHSGRKRICSEEMLAQVHETVEKSPGKSSRRKCQELDLTRSTMPRVMGKDLIIQGIIAEKGFDVKLSRGNVIPSRNGSI